MSIRSDVMMCAATLDIAVHVTRTLRKIVKSYRERNLPNYSERTCVRRHNRGHGNGPNAKADKCHLGLGPMCDNVGGEFHLSSHGPPGPITASRGIGDGP